MINQSSTYARVKVVKRILDVHAAGTRRQKRVHQSKVSEEGRASGEERVDTSTMLRGRNGIKEQQSHMYAQDTAY